MLKKGREKPITSTKGQKLPIGSEAVLVLVIGFSLPFFKPLE